MLHDTGELLGGVEFMLAGTSFLISCYLLRVALLSKNLCLDTLLPSCKFYETTRSSTADDSGGGHYVGASQRPSRNRQGEIAQGDSVFLLRGPLASPAPTTPAKIKLFLKPNSLG